MKIELRELQRLVREWRADNFGQESAQGIRVADMVKNKRILGAVVAVLGATEEVGELSHCLLKHLQGIRGYEDSDKFEEEARDAVGDIIIYLMGFCDAFGWDLRDIVKETAEEVTKRNWNEDKVNAAERTSIPVKVEVTKGTLISRPHGFYDYFLIAIACSLKIVLGKRKQDYNVNVDIRDYWEVNGVKSPLQMVDMKEKRARSAINALENADDMSRIDVASKIIDSMVDCISYSAFTIAELMLREELPPEIFEKMYDVDPGEPAGPIFEAVGKVLGSEGGCHE